MCHFLIIDSSLLPHRKKMIYCRNIKLFYFFPLLLDIKLYKIFVMRIFFEASVENEHERARSCLFFCGNDFGLGMKFNDFFFVEMKLKRDLVCFYGGFMED